MKESTKSKPQTSNNEIPTETLFPLNDPEKRGKPQEMRLSRLIRSQAPQKLIMTGRDGFRIKYGMTENGRKF